MSLVIFLGLYGYDHILKFVCSSSLVIKNEMTIPNSLWSLKWRGSAALERTIERRVWIPSTRPVFISLITMVNACLIAALASDEVFLMERVHCNAPPLQRSLKLIRTQEKLKSTFCPTCKHWEERQRITFANRNGNYGINVGSLIFQFRCVVFPSWSFL